MCSFVNLINDKEFFISTKSIVHYYFCERLWEFHHFVILQSCLVLCQRLCEFLIIFFKEMTTSPRAQRFVPFFYVSFSVFLLTAFFRISSAVSGCHLTWQYREVGCHNINWNGNGILIREWSLYKGKNVLLKGSLEWETGFVLQLIDF